MPLSSDRDASDQEACRSALRGGSKSFDAAAKLLPRAVRAPAVALYAFCREADDAIDSGTGSLEWLQQRLHLAYEGQPLAIPADRGLAWIVRDFAIPRALPEALLEGFAWDATGRRYQTLSDLRAYAVRVAGTVGAMMAVLMGVRDAGRMAAAVDLGVAMQLSNIARDVGEDARNGRLYLPLDWLHAAGIDTDAFLANPGFSPALAGVIARLLDAADLHYRQAGAGITRLPLACRPGIGAARLLYAEIGREVARRGMDSVSGRAVVPGRRKARVLAAGLPRMILPLQPLAGACVPEGAFLVDAVVQAAPRPAQAGAAIPWWALAERVRWTIDLFEQMERREWMPR
ncbi:MAG: phytoene synthase [Rhodospirillales bacterium 20-64-7]|nr:MAG: phytoene synthase [Rhodospirillales bacterium 20-64-7]HQT75632.1 phytoene/squalene synthase family protein [Rhodopila sp.]